MAGRAGCRPLRAAAACILRTCVRAAFLFNILTLYYICKSMKWQDFGKIKKDKFAAAAESGRQPCGLPMDSMRWARRAKWCKSCGGALGEMVQELWGCAGRNDSRSMGRWAKCIFTRKKVFFEGGFVYKFTNIRNMTLCK